MAVKTIVTVVAVVLQVIISCSQAQDYKSLHARTSGGNTGQYKGSINGEDTGPYMDGQCMYLLHIAVDWTLYKRDLY